MKPLSQLVAHPVEWNLPNPALNADCVEQYNIGLQEQRGSQVREENIQSGYVTEVNHLVAEATPLVVTHLLDAMLEILGKRIREKVDLTSLAHGIVEVHKPTIAQIHRCIKNLMGNRELMQEFARNPSFTFDRLFESKSVKLSRLVDMTTMRSWERKGEYFNKVTHVGGDTVELWVWTQADGHIMGMRES